MSEFGASAWVNRETGAIHMRSDWDRDQFGPMPEDVEEGAKYARLPDPRDLDLAGAGDESRSSFDGVRQTTARA
jgi:hypothetical protein